MSSIISSNYDLLSSYSTASSTDVGTVSADKTSEFVQMVNDLLVETEEILSDTLSTDEAENEEGADVDKDEDETDGDDSTSDSTTGSITSGYSVYMRDDGDDPLATDDTPSDELSFYDMLQLMILQFQSQTIDNTASTTDMMNQLVQMTTMQAMTSMEDSITAMTKTNEMLYTSSLVGQEVTVGYYDSNGNFLEDTGIVTAAGYYGGYPVVFLDGHDTFFYTSEILAVGVLPTATEDDEEVEDPEDIDGSEGVDGTAGSDSSGVTDNSDDDNVSVSVGSSDDKTQADTVVDVGTSGTGVTDETTDGTAEEMSLYGYNYVDYSNMTAEEILEASVTALG